MAFQKLLHVGICVWDLCTYVCIVVHSSMCVHVYVYNVCIMCVGSVSVCIVTNLWRSEDNLPSCSSLSSLLETSLLAVWHSVWHANLWASGIPPVSVLCIPKGTQELWAHRFWNHNSNPHTCVEITLATDWAIYPTTIRFLLKRMSFESLFMWLIMKFTLLPCSQW